MVYNNAAVCTQRSDLCNQRSVRQAADRTLCAAGASAQSSTGTEAGPAVPLPQTCCSAPQSPMLPLRRWQAAALLNTQLRPDTCEQTCGIVCRLRVPRRPDWDSRMAPDILDKQERAAFLEWRRDLARHDPYFSGCCAWGECCSAGSPG